MKIITNGQKSIILPSNPTSPYALKVTGRFLEVYFAGGKEQIELTKPLTTKEANEFILTDADLLDLCP